MTDERQGNDVAERTTDGDLPPGHVIVEQTPAPAPAPSKATKAERLEAKAARLRAAQERRAVEATERGAPAPRRWIVATAVVSVGAAAAIALLTITFASWQHQRHVNSARAAAVLAAKAFAVDFGSYNYQHLDSDWRGVTARMTPSFGKDYLRTSARLKPTYTQYKAQVTAHIRDVGVSSASTSQATVLVFLDQTVLTSQSSTPRIDRNRLEIHLVHRGGKWLVARLYAK